MITDERLARLIEFASCLSKANQVGVSDMIPLIAVPSEALDILTELAERRDLKPQHDEQGRLILVKSENVQ